jgi:hypothetical protein
VQWLTVPVGQAIDRRVRDVTLSPGWEIKHWKSLESNYRRSRFFDEVASWLNPIYLDQRHDELSQLNRCLIEAICAYLGITTRITCSWDYELVEGKSRRLASLTAQAGGTEYVSGPSAKQYIDKQAFDDGLIRLTWFDYDGYPEYPQLWGKFEHGVTILDLLFNCGRESPRQMRYVAPTKASRDGS